MRLDRSSRPLGPTGGSSRRRRRSRRAAAAASTAICLLSSLAAVQRPHGAAAFQSSPSALPLAGISKFSASTGALKVSSLSRIRIGSSTIRMASPPSSMDQQQQNATDTPEQFDGSGSRGMDGSNNRIISPPSESESHGKESTIEAHGNENKNEQSLPPLLQKVVDKVGKIDESRLSSTPEYQNGDVPQLFSNLQYSTIQHDDGTETTVSATAARRSDSSFLSSSALLCGTALGCGLLTLPTAIDPTAGGAGYLPTIVASFVAWAYMTISALLTSELLINKIGETGKVRNVGLLELYTSYLGETGGKIAGTGFLIVSYVVMGVYLSEGGDMLSRLLEMTGDGGGGLGGALPSSGDGASVLLRGDSSSTAIMTSSMLDNHSLLARALFATLTATFLTFASKLNNVQKALTHFFLPLTLVAFASALVIGLPTANFAALTAAENQHPEVVLNAFPLLFMGWTYHGVVPRVVYDLEGNKDEITKAIVAGSTTALVMYLAWNAMVVGNVLGNGELCGVGVVGIDGIAGLAREASSVVGSLEQSSAVVLGDMLGMEGDKGSAAALANAASASMNTINLEPIMLRSSVALVSELAVITSLIGVVLGFVNEFNDAVFGGASTKKTYGPTDKDNKWKVALLTLLPPAIISTALGLYSETEFDVNNYQIIDYTGIFGSSVLFLILPALMAWQNRYAEEDPPRPLTVRPMVPLGKISLGSLYKAAGTLILEQGLEKLGVFDFVKEQFARF